MLGYAATLTITGSSPPVARTVYEIERTSGTTYLGSLPEPRVLVIEDSSERPGFGSLVAAVHLSILLAVHCVGVGTNGSVRYISVLLHVSGSICSLPPLRYPTHASASSKFAKSVHIGGLKIESGNLLHGDPPWRPVCSG